MISPGFAALFAVITFVITRRRHFLWRGLWWIGWGTFLCLQVAYNPEYEFIKYAVAFILVAPLIIFSVLCILFMGPPTSGGSQPPQFF